METFSWRFYFVELSYKFYHSITWVQNNFRKRLLYDTFRFNYLKNYWHSQMNELKVELYRDRKNKKAKSLLKLFDTYDETLTHDLLLLWLERCKRINNCVFYQFYRRESDFTETSVEREKNLKDTI